MTPENFRANVQERIKRRKSRAQKRKEATDDLEEVLCAVLPSKTRNGNLIRVKRSSRGSVELTHECDSKERLIATITPQLHGRRFTITIGSLGQIPPRAWKYLKNWQGGKVSEGEMYRRLSKFFGHTL